jgi:hypothetical protein
MDWYQFIQGIIFNSFNMKVIIEIIFIYIHTYV